MTHRCPACNHQNRSGRRFCAECGSGLRHACPACGAENEAGDKFCGQCGAALTAGSAPTASVSRETPRAPRDYTPRHLAEKILTSKSSLEGERKNVTVLFADVAGYTSIAERSDPEAMHALMDRFFQCLLAEVHRVEGTVNQFTGDGVMALFGAPIALEDAPRRAVSAARAIQRVIEPLGADVRKRLGVDFRVRIGIHTGPVVVGRIGDDLRMDYTAVGDTTNLAARLQQMAEPGAILVSRATQNRVAAFFEMDDLGELRVKGKSQPVRAFRVGNERPVSGRVEASVGSGLTPLVGRESDLAAMASSFQAAQSDRGQVAFLVGDAGIGKSRLLYEFRAQLADQPHTWFEGRCASYARASAFQPIVDGLQRLFGIDDRDHETSVLAKIETGVAAAPGDLAWTLPLLRVLLSLPAGDPAVEAMDAAERRSETIRALHAFFFACAERAPLVVVIEDLHWIDPASEEFLGFLSDSLPASKLLAIYTHRPGYRHPFGDHSYHVRVALQPLSTQEMAAMTGALLKSGTLPESLGALIASKAEGNPFFVEEVTKSLLDEGAVHIADGDVTLARDVSEISVPDSIHDVLMARIDRLADDPKHAIQVASVIGREFALRLLQRITDAGDEVSSVVEELRSLELIYEKSAHPELAFMFKHALTHDVAYESILIQRRRALHRIVGTAIEELYPDRLAEHYESLAHHFARAEEWERAFLYHGRAAEKAAAAYANHSAAEHYREALAIAERLGDRVPRSDLQRLSEGLGGVLWLLSYFDQSGDAHLRSAEWADGPDKRAVNLAWAGHGKLWGHEYEQARICAGRAIEVAREHDLPGAHALALACLDLDDLVHGRVTDDSVAAEAIRLAEASGDPAARVLSLQQLEQRLEWRGEFRKAVKVGRTAIAIAQEQRLSTLAVFPTWFAGIALTCLGDYATALEWMQDSLELCGRLGDRALTARVLNTLGWCYAEFGAHDRANEFNRRGEEMAREIVELQVVASAPELHANAMINLAGNYVAMGDPERAEALILPIREELSSPGDPWQRWRYSMHVNHALARVALTRHDPETVLRLTQEELEAARANPSRKIEARALELRGRALLTQDDRDAAEETLGQALAIAVAIEYPPVQWRAHAFLAELGRRRGEPSRVERSLISARALIENLSKSIPDADLQRDFRGLAERLEADPFTACR
jgi:class 3 adenylate cyclase/tetratricopeptide (TPR) repeat protein